jgi:hypothetical protein
MLAVGFATISFGFCCWFEIFKMLDQRLSGRVHFIGNRDCAINLQWELAGCVALAILSSIAIRLSPHATDNPNLR